MRLLMLFTIGICASMSFCAYLVWNDPVLWLLLAAACFFLFLSCLCLRKRAASVAAVILLGAAAGNLWYWGYDGLYLGSARTMDQTVDKTQIRVTDYSFSTDYGSAADGRLTIGGKSYRVRLYLNGTGDLEPGDLVEGTFRFRFTSGGAERGATFHRGEGVFLLAYAQGSPEITREGARSLAYLPAWLRNQSLSQIQKLFPENARAFASALLLGMDDELTYEQNTALNLSGIRHVVAVSGQHLVILMAAVLLLTGKNRRIACCLSIPVMLLFSAMAGFSPSILRSLIMQLVLLAAFLIREEYDGLTALAFSVLCMVLVNPLAVTSVSLQLSTASVAGLFLFSARIYQRIRGWWLFSKIQPHSTAGRVLHWIVGTSSVTLASMITTLPLCAIHFGTVSLVGVVTNLATLWIISLIFYGIILAVLVGAVWLPAGAVLGKVLSWPIRYVLGISKALASLPVSCLYLCNLWIIAACLLAYGVLLLWIFSKRLRLWQGGLLICAILSSGLAISWTAPLGDSYRITMLDVGQGQCILLQSGQRTYMVDCGGDHPESVADLAAQTLLSMGIDRLDGLIITHFDEDHAGAAEYLLSRIETDQLILPQDPEHPDAQQLPRLCSGENVVATRDLFAAWPGGSITVFAGNGGDYGNEMSLCVLFQSGNCDILITGDRPVDREIDLLRHTGLPELEYLVAGHHGAATSTGESLLRVTRPDTVLISVGKYNRYGHPSPSVLERLRKYGCAVRRTDLEGTILIRG